MQGGDPVARSHLDPQAGRCIGVVSVVGMLGLDIGMAKRLCMLRREY